MLTVIFRTALLYFFVIIGIRLMGKRQIGEMQPGELVVTLLISEMAAIPLQDLSQPVLLGVASISTLVFLELVFSLLFMKLPRLHRLISGRERIIIQDGVLNQRELKNLRITVLDLLELLRDRGVYDVSTVAYAVMETSGSLSVLLKTSEQPATKGDFSKGGNDSVFLPVISDGVYLSGSLSELGLCNADVESILAENKTSQKEIFLLCIDKDKNYTLIKKEASA